MEKLESATEQSSYVMKLVFKDELGGEVVPITAKWRLTDGLSAVVNDRDDVTITNLDSTVYVALSGADITPRDTRAENVRYLVATGTYGSSVTGSTLPVAASVTFIIEDI